MKKLLLTAFALSAMLISCSDDDSGPSTKSLTLTITGLQNLGDEFVYEGWVIVDGSPISTGTFTIDDAGAWSASSFDVLSSDLEAATKFVLTIEPIGESGDAALTPSDQKLLAGDFTGNTAAVSTSVAPAVGDFSNASGTFFLRTPTDEAAGTDNNGNDEYGIWFGIPGTTPPDIGLDLPTLPDGWVYEGWVVGETGPISTGRFTAFDEVDSSNGFSGSENNLGPPIPGEDFLNNAPSGETFPMNVRGRTVVISVEPSPDNSFNPFFLKPLLSTLSSDALTVGEGANAPNSHDLGQNLGSLPTGTVSY